MRSPAGNIRALLDFYQSDPIEENLQLFLEKMDIVSDDLMETINDLAEVVKIKNELAQDVDLLDLNKLVEKAKDSLSEQIKLRKATIEVDFSDLDEIYASKPYMDSIFLNLLSNAIKYSKDDVAPIIKLKSMQNNKHCILTIEDNGLGIDLEKFGSKVFGLRKTFHRNRDSRGVGLFITKAQVEAMKGTISITSMPLVGTTFTITIPQNYNL